MDVYHIQMESTPAVVFAHRFGTNQYDIYNPGQQDMFEISYILQGDCRISIESENTDLYVPCDTLVCTLYNTPHHFISDKYHQHVTVGFRMLHSMSDEGGLVFPRLIRFETPDNPLRKQIEQVVLLHALHPKSTLVTAKLVELLGSVSSYYLSTEEKEQTFGAEWYISRAKRYVVEHLSKPIQVADVAAYLEISPGYLSHMFSSVMNQTVIEYINYTKMKRVEELVLSYGLSVREAGLQVGFNDSNYVSRLFRRVQGCSLSELKHMRWQKP